MHRLRARGASGPPPLPAPGTEPAEARTIRQTRGVIGFAATVGLFWAALYVYVPVLAPHAARLGASVDGVGLVLATYGLAEFLFRFPPGLWSDRLTRRRPLMLVAFGVAAVSAVGMGLSPTPQALGAFRGLSGLAASGWVPVTLLAVDLFPEDRTAMALGVVTFAAGAGQMAALLLGGHLASWGGYPATFWVAMLAVGSLALAVRAPDARRQAGAHRFAGARLSERFSPRLAAGAGLLAAGAGTALAPFTGGIAALTGAGALISIGMGTVTPVRRLSCLAVPVAAQKRRGQQRRDLRGQDGQKHSR